MTSDAGVCCVVIQPLGCNVFLARPYKMNEESKITRGGTGRKRIFPKYKPNVTCMYVQKIR